MGDKAERTCPEWIDEIIDDIGVGIDSGVMPYAYDAWGPEGDEEYSDDPWVIHFYPTLSEVVGGAHDGSVVYPGITVDMTTIQECFEDIEYMTWCTKPIGEPRYHGSALEVMGWYEGHPVLLKIFEQPPSDDEVRTKTPFSQVFFYPGPKPKA